MWILHSFINEAPGLFISWSHHEKRMAASKLSKTFSVKYVSKNISPFVSDHQICR